MLQPHLAVLKRQEEEKLQAQREEEERARAALELKEKEAQAARTGSPLRVFLDSIRLSQYATLFEKEGIDMTTIFDLTEAELTHLGLPLGPRKTLLKANPANGGAYNPVGARSSLTFSSF